MNDGAENYCTTGRFINYYLITNYLVDFWRELMPWESTCTTCDVANKTITEKKPAKIEELVILGIVIKELWNRSANSSVGRSV